jgi:2',3'-cyclic-nucleotide 2'-phosphodiesterase (5'-nucleotidase family)
MFSPSLLSSKFKGEQMVGYFNKLGVAVSALGNHDLDFGVERMEELTKATSPCKWLMTNLSWKVENPECDEERRIGGIGRIHV